jgi:hypothetical protein
MRLLAAWLRRSHRRDQDGRPGDDQQFAEWTRDAVRRDLCSCPSRRLVVIHTGGTYCGDQQTERIAEVLAVTASALRFEPDTVEADYEQMATAALDTLRGDHHAAR